MGAERRRLPGAMTRRSLFRAALQGDAPALGTWVKLPTIASMELIALAGFDFAVIDLEHSPIDLETTYDLIGVGLLSGVSPIVRIPALEPGIVQRVLDAGADGIMVPHVDTAHQARAAASYVRFPPLGVRGVGATSRAGAWGALPREEYVRFGQEEAVLIAQLESAEAIRNSGAIARVPGVDAVLVGAADLSMTEGIQESDPRVRTMMTDAVAQATAEGVPVGGAGGAGADAVRAAIDVGFRFVLMGNDAGLLGAAAREAVRAGRSVSTS